MAFRGGFANKLGNEYERKWTVRKFLNVIDGKANAIRYEGVPGEFRGFEFALHRPDLVEWHQTKINAPRGNWTPTALYREGLIEAFKSRLSSDATAKCIFVSQDPARQLRELCNKARMANDLHEFRGAIAKEEGKAFDDLLQMWDVDDKVGFGWLRRCEFRTESEQSIAEAIEWYGRHLLKGNADIFASLSNYLVNNLNVPIRTEVARKWISTSSPFTFRPGSLDPTLREDVDAANHRYLNSYTPFGVAGGQIPRAEAKDVLVELQSPDGPSLILVTGEAGCGKSGVVREVVAGLTDSAVPHLAFRIDRHLSCQSIKELSTAVLNRDESPVSALENLSEGKTSVLIIDQIDAVSEVSGRTSAIKDILFELFRETRQYGDVRCLLVCRSFDLENDPQYRELEQEGQSKRVEVKPLSWDDDVAPILTHNGVSAERFTRSERRLLCLPLHLAVFLEIGDPTLGFTTGTALMRGLLEKKTRDLRRDRNIAWNVQAPLCAMAEWMSEKQELSCPDAVLNEFDGAKDLLSSEGLIVTEQHRLAFFHESFFDFIFARSFVRSNQDIIEFLTSTEQHLFRRTQVRQILNSMRDTDRPRYLRTLAEVLTNCKVRLHVKLAVSYWLTTVNDATLDELNIIQSLDDDAEEFPILIRRALFVSDAWFDLLDEGGQLSRILEGASSPRRHCMLGWLSDISRDRPGAVALVLRRWWRDDPARTGELTVWFQRWRRIPKDPTLTALLCDVICSRSDRGSQQDDLMGRMSLLRPLWETEPEMAMGVVKQLFAQWFKENPGSHPFKYVSRPVGNVSGMSKVVNNTPAVFLDAMIPMLVESAEIDSNDDSYSSRIRIRHDPDAEGGPDALLSLYRKAFCNLAATSPNEAEVRLGKIDPKLHKVMTHLHLETIRANPDGLGHRFEGLLDVPHLFKAGYEHAEWNSFATAARSVVRVNRDSIQIVEERILNHHPELEEATQIMGMIRSNGEDKSCFVTKCNALKSLGRSGQEQWHILETIGSDLLSSLGAKRLAELQRKFSSVRVPKSDKKSSDAIESPVPQSAVTKMSDDQWLAAIKKYHRHNAHIEPENETIVGGTFELARELGVVTRADPGRFARLFLRLPRCANPINGQHLLQGLAAAEQVDEGATMAALQVAHAYPEQRFGMQIVHIIERHPSCARDDNVFQALLWYATHGDVCDEFTRNENEDPCEFALIDDLVQANRHIYQNGIDSVRGVAWQVLGQVVAHQADRAADLWTLVECQSAAEISTSVRTMMLYALIPLYRHDRDRFWVCLKRLTKPIAGIRDEITALQPLATNAGVELFYVIERDLPDLALELMERLIGSPDRTLHLVGVWWALAERLRQGNTKNRFQGIDRRSPAHSKLWASILCENVADTENRTMAISELSQLFSHDVLEVRNAAAEVFRGIPENEIAAFSDLAEAFIRSAAFTDDADNADEIIRYLEKTSHDVTELVLEASEVIARNCGDADRDSYYGIEKLLIREYRNSEDLPDLRERILDVIDKMAEKNILGADDLLRLEDR